MAIGKQEEPNKGRTAWPVLIAALVGAILSGVTGTVLTLWRQHELFYTAPPIPELSISGPSSKVPVPYPTKISGTDSHLPRGYTVWVFDWSPDTPADAYILGECSPKTATTFECAQVRVGNASDPSSTPYEVEVAAIPGSQYSAYATALSNSASSGAVAGTANALGTVGPEALAWQSVPVLYRR
jgi:hypothetical protein